MRRGVGVVHVGVEQRCQGLYELGVGFHLRIFLGQFVLTHPGVLQQEDLALFETLDRVPGLVAEGVGHELYVLTDVVGEDVGVVGKRNEGVTPRPPLVGQADDAVTRFGELADGCGVSPKAAVVLDGTVLDGRVHIEPDEHPLVGGQFIEG